MATHFSPHELQVILGLPIDFALIVAIAKSGRRTVICTVFNFIFYFSSFCSTQKKSKNLLPVGKSLSYWRLSCCLEERSLVRFYARSQLRVNGELLRELASTFLHPVFCQKIPCFGLIFSSNFLNVVELL